jgi:hypothetical protein
MKDWSERRDHLQQPHRSAAVRTGNHRRLALFRRQLLDQIAAIFQDPLLDIFVRFPRVGTQESVMADLQPLSPRASIATSSARTLSSTVGMYRRVVAAGQTEYSWVSVSKKAAHRVEFSEVNRDNGRRDCPWYWREIGGALRA